MIHRGAMEGIEAAFEALVRWIEDSGYRLAGPSRELYHEFHDEDPTPARHRAADPGHLLSPRHRQS